MLFGRFQVRVREVFCVCYCVLESLVCSHSCHHDSLGQALGLRDHEDPNGWKICTAASHFPDENFQASGYWPIDGNHAALEEAGVPASRWNLLYPLLPYDV